MKTALVLEGGALRGIFTSGVMDYFIDNNVQFDYICAVSAGSCNALQYLGKQRKYMKRCLMETKENPFFGIGELIENKKFINLDKIFYEYAEELGYDYSWLDEKHIPFEFVVTNINTGKAEYMSSDDIEKIRLIGKASCSMPFLTSPVEIDGQLYQDGGIADSIPLKHAFDMGYDRAVVVATRKEGSYSVTNEAQKILYKRMYKDYPEFIKAGYDRTELYYSQVKYCEEMEKEGKIVLLRPTISEVSRLESDEDALSLSYYHGYTKARERIDDINGLLY
ncbi:MAG: patatin family protein [Erysipelotrichaceae bacterium]|nr:patatin family protein [Erysipelotrichaceae bacterium]